jgi:hypothetical protein
MNDREITIGRNVFMNNAIWISMENSIERALTVGIDSTCIATHVNALAPVLSRAKPAKIPPITPPISKDIDKYAESSADVFAILDE